MAIDNTPKVNDPEEQHTRSVKVYYSKEAIDKLIKTDAMLQVGWMERDPDDPKITATITLVENVQNYDKDTLGVRVWVKVEEDMLNWGLDDDA